MARYCERLPHHTSPDILLPLLSSLPLFSILTQFPILLSLSFLTSSLAPPSIKATSGSVTALEGSDLTLNCTAIGNPAPTYEWIRLDGSLSSKTRGINSSKLLIPSFEWSDAGMYACLASNQWGSAQSEMLYVTLQSESLSAAVARGK